MDSSTLMDGSSEKDTKGPTSTRHNREPPEDTRNIPRLGRRESEPHSVAITYLHDVFTHNFPEDRVLWDLHHYFTKEGLTFDIQFDISYFLQFKLPQLLASYKASDFENRIPTLAINILSKSTFRDDVGENVDICRLIGIPVYIIFCSHTIERNIYNPPFLRVYMKQKDGSYLFSELRKPTIVGEIKEDNAILDHSAIIDTSSYLPFRIGLWETNQKYFPDRLTYNLILIDSKKLMILPRKVDYLNTDLLQEKTRADQEKTRADQEKTRADQLTKTLQKYQKKFGQLP